MKDKNVLRDEEIKNKSAVFVRELVDITKASTITDPMLDTPNRKMEYADIVIEFQKNNEDFFRIKKSRYCNIGLYVSQKFHTKKIEEWQAKEKDYEKEIEKLNSEVHRLGFELTECQLKLKKKPLLVQFFDWISSKD